MRFKLVRSENVWMIVWLVIVEAKKPFSESTISWCWFNIDLKGVNSLYLTYRCIKYY